jgi:hypothetical protein
MNPSRRAALLIFLCTLLVYIFPLVYNAVVTPFFHAIPSQDVVSASLVPASILTRGNFYLDQYRRYIANNYTEPYFVDQVNNHLVSRYPIVAGVLSLPFVGAGLGTGWIARTVNIFDVAKLSAAWIAGLAVLAFFFCARKLADLRTALAVTLAFAFGTSVWSTASQGLWQHTPSLLFQLLALWFLLRGDERGASPAPAGLFLSLAVISRPTNAVTALVLGAYFVFRYRRRLLAFVLWALPPLLLALLYNAGVNGSPFVFGYQEGVAQQFSLPRWEAAQGLLFSPSRGLFVLSPFLLLAPVGLWFGWYREHQSLYAFLAVAFVGYTGVMAAWGSLGGWAYGARMLTDALPSIALLLVPAVSRLRGWSRAGSWTLLILAAAVQSLGLWDYGVRFHSDPANSVWSIENNEPLFYLRLYFSMFQEFLGLSA